MKAVPQSSRFWTPVLWRFGSVVVPLPVRIPAGFCLKAQGYGEGATLGGVKHFAQPKRGCGTGTREGHNPVGVVQHSRHFPRVARASQPWAGRHNPGGIAVGQMFSANIRLRDASVKLR